jgi:adenylosuccinate lyase
MIPRYSPKDVAELFSDEHRFDTMLEVELLAAEGLADQGILPVAEVATLRTRRPVVDAAFVAAVDERELVTNHDTAAFVDVPCRRELACPKAGGSTTVSRPRTSLILLSVESLTSAMDIVINDATALRDALTRRAVESIDWPILGRTHGMHAEPTTYGAKFSLFALQVERDIERAQQARTAIAVGKLSGAVGTYSNIDPGVEAYVCERLGLVSRAVDASDRATVTPKSSTRARHWARRWNCSRSKFVISRAVRWVRPKSPLPRDKRVRR